MTPRLDMLVAAVASVLCDEAAAASPSLPNTPRSCFFQNSGSIPFLDTRSEHMLRFGRRHAHTYGGTHSLHKGRAPEGTNASTLADGASSEVKRTAINGEMKVCDTHEAPGSGGVFTALHGARQAIHTGSTYSYKACHAVPATSDCEGQRQRSPLLGARDTVHKIGGIPGFKEVVSARELRGEKRDGRRLCY